MTTEEADEVPPKKGIDWITHKLKTMEYQHRFMRSGGIEGQEEDGDK